ncbi:AKT-interacting protein [Frankliniella fusca]|uniref:AKT-interacting protein n=1 Tax=Frankliniella fusca TaxID=407009 RepID=A0AAE1LXF2_9NEOP|nr:AKT-interacting protein [Frankliniella fusca]
MIDKSGDFNGEEAEPFKRQGSLRKVLPPNPSSEGPMSLSAKMIDRPAVSNRNVNRAYSSYLQEYSIIAEYGMVREQSIPGVYVIPSAKSSLLWFGVLFVRQGMYQGGVFRFTLSVPENFPDTKSPPRITFQSPIFHPQVDMKSGEMNVKREFPEWRKGFHHLWQVLEYMRTAFYMLDMKEPVNDECSEMYKSNPELFSEKLKLCVKNSQDHLYDPPPVDDPHYLRFDPYDKEKHEPVRESILHPKRDDGNPSSLGLSWVQPGSLEPFSKPSL